MVPNVLGDTFCLAIIDNIDFDGSSNTGNNAFHGTSISINQQPLESSSEPPTFSFSDQKYKIELPGSYACVNTMNSLNMSLKKNESLLNTFI